MSSATPYRVEFFDDEIETVRSFDPDTQRGLEKAERIELLPAHEFPLNEAGIGLFRRQFRNAFAAESKNAPIYQEVSEARAPAGIEYYTPLFFEETAVLFDYLPKNVTVIRSDGVVEAIDQFQANTAERFEQRRHDVERPVLPPDTLFLAPDEVAALLEPHTVIDTRRFEIEAKGRDVLNLPTKAPGLYPVEARAERPMGALSAFIDEFVTDAKGRVLFVAESNGRREMLLDQLMGNRLAPEAVEDWAGFLASERPLCLTTAPLDRGLLLPQAGVAVITEAQLGAARVKRRERRRPTRDSDAIIANLTELNIGAPVVHIGQRCGALPGPDESETSVAWRTNT